ncbi:Crp/Fnr family transcriptional regulator [Megasphaera sp.]|uniref:Crp/Fnr family transcriptional regulator n=1 Tax=Megasphaera sp. TaxID=2023260 RepID=UPI003520A145
MEQYLSLIEKSPLFKGIAESDVMSLLQHLKVRKKTYKKGDFLFFSGDTVSYIGLVLEGAVHIIQEDYWGNRNILSQIPAGYFFGEAFACLPGSAATVDVVAAVDTTIMQVYLENVLHAGQTLTAAQVRFMANLLGLMSQKNRLLTEKMRYLTQRSTRQKIMLYLSDLARRTGKNSFMLPFNRQQMADFLSVDRSALSAELSKMKKDGLIDYRKDKFTLLE